MDIIGTILIIGAGVVLAFVSYCHGHSDGYRECIEEFGYLLEEELQ